MRLLCCQWFYNTTKQRQRRILQYAQSRRKLATKSQNQNELPTPIMTRIGLFKCFQVLVTLLCIVANAFSQNKNSAEDFLSLGDQHLSQDQSQEAIEFYEQGIQAIDKDVESLITVLSLHTNCATAYSSLGQNEKARDYYQKALVQYTKDVDDIEEESVQKDATGIAAQASFFLGMVYQDLEQYHDAVDAYSQAHLLDEYHWAAVANLAAVYHDSLADHRKALQAYNQAYEILTQKDVEPTDAPGEPRFILSQLQYRIGLCIAHDIDAKCVMEDAPDTPVSCKELATNAFAQAIEFDPDNEVSEQARTQSDQLNNVHRISNFSFSCSLPNTCWLPLLRMQPSSEPPTIMLSRSLMTTLESKSCCLPLIAFC